MTLMITQLPFTKNNNKTTTKTTNITISNNNTPVDASEPSCPLQRFLWCVSGKRNVFSSNDKLFKHNNDKTAALARDDPTKDEEDPSELLCDEYYPAAPVSHVRVVRKTANVIGISSRADSILSLLECTASSAAAYYCYDTGEHDAHPQFDNGNNNASSMNHHDRESFVSVLTMDYDMMDKSTFVIESSVEI